ncbi:universal stress protein [Actinoplanes missouriensis]|uniref:universal stress protein n=1 Tax=Actinoplanes missouriensis TaxID=1866 RepID=UPI0034079309
MSTRGTVLVGTDGSLAAQEAVLWAAVEAQRREVTLAIVTAYAEPGPGTPGTLARDHAQAVVAAAGNTARQVAPATTVHTEIVAGDPAAVLVRASTPDGLVVVGPRGSGGFTGLMVGSVSLSVAAHAPGPVAVVRGRSTAWSGPVAVSADDAPGSDPAIDTAFAEANARNTAVLAVGGHPEPLSPLRPEPEHDEAREKALADRLETRLAPWRREFPAVPVRSIISAGSPARLLVGASHQAQLVVVGNRGPVWSQVLHHADCPVLIIRA